MVMRDDVMTRARAANPVKAHEVEGWSNSPDGGATLERILAASRYEGVTRRRLASRGVLISAGVVLIASLAAAGYGVTHRAVTKSARGMVACTAQFDQQGDMAIVAVKKGLGAEGTCKRVVEAGFWARPPRNLVSCVLNYPNGEGGGLAVFSAPADMGRREACTRLGAALPPRRAP